MRRKQWFSAAVLGAALVTSCSESSGSGSAPACIAGSKIACPCAAGGAGTQTCRSDGTFDACVCAGLPDAGTDATVDAPTDAPCVPETDAAFCTRLGKTCEQVMASDNCGASRAAACGTCSAAGSTSACVANVCKAPACATTNNYGGSGTIVTSLSAGGSQDALLGVSSSAASVLYLHAAAGTCVPSGATLLIGDATTVALPTPPTYTTKDLSAVANLAGFSKQEQSMTLSGDGRTIIGVDTAGRAFLTSTRSALAQTDFTLAAEGPFAAVNAAVPAGAKLAYPVQSADGLAFYWQVGGATNTSMNGLYEALRSLTSAPFAAGQKMPAAVQAFEAITGISSDRMTLFVTASFTTSTLSRNSLQDPFGASTIAPPAMAFRVTPVTDCSSIFGTCEPGGCQGETICIWTKH